MPHLALHLQANTMIIKTVIPLGLDLDTEVL